MEQDRVGIGDRLTGLGHAHAVTLPHVFGSVPPVHIHVTSVRM